MYCNPTGWLNWRQNMQDFSQEHVLSLSGWQPGGKLLWFFLSFLTRLLEDGKKDTHSEALLRAYSVAGNIYFCPEMSRGEPSIKC